MGRCNGITKSNTQCRRHVKQGAEYCNQHAPKTEDVSNRKHHDTKCSICLEVNNDDSMMCEGCKNYNHEECIAGMWKMECPLCRADITKQITNKDTIKRIEENARIKREEDERTARDIARSYQESFRIIPLGTFIVPRGRASRSGIPDNETTRLIIDFLRTLSLSSAEE